MDYYTSFKTQVVEAHLCLQCITNWKIRLWNRRGSITSSATILLQNRASQNSAAYYTQLIECSWWAGFLRFSWSGLGSAGWLFFRPGQWDGLSAEGWIRSIPFVSHHSRTNASRAHSQSRASPTHSHIYSLCSFTPTGISDLRKPTVKPCISEARKHLVLPQESGTASGMV